LQYRFQSADHQRGHRSETGREGLVAACAADALNDVFAAEFLQIIGSVARAVLERVEFAEEADPGGDLRGGKAVGGRRKGDHRLDDMAHPRLVEIDAPDEGLADLRREGELLEHVISDEALIDATESVSVLRNKAIKPLLAAVRPLRPARGSHNPKPIDAHYQTIQGQGFALKRLADNSGRVRCLELLTKNLRNFGRQQHYIGRGRREDVAAVHVDQPRQADRDGRAVSLCALRLALLRRPALLGCERQAVGCAFGQFLLGEKGRQCRRFEIRNLATAGVAVDSCAAAGIVGDDAVRHAGRQPCGGIVARHLAEPDAGRALRRIERGFERGCQHRFFVVGMVARPAFAKELPADAEAVGLLRAAPVIGGGRPPQIGERDRKPMPGGLNHRIRAILERELGLEAGRDAPGEQAPLGLRRQRRERGEALRRRQLQPVEIECRTLCFDQLVGGRAVQIVERAARCGFGCAPFERVRVGAEAVEEICGDRKEGQIEPVRKKIEEMPIAGPPAPFRGSSEQSA
jgi:hypothetical protein